MTIQNTDERYGWLAKAFHWVMAILIITMLFVGNFMGKLEGPTKFKVYGLHKSTGILILFLVFLRLTWRQMSYQPPVPPTNKVSKKLFDLMEFAAKASHALIYILMFAMPLTGWMMSSGVGFPVSFYGLFVMPNLVSPGKETAELFGNLHFYFSWTLIFLLCAHIGAALLHHFYFKDNVMKRMLPAILVVLSLFAFNAAAIDNNNKWNIVSEGSRIEWTATQNGAPVKGGFSKFDGEIVFDEKDLPNSHITINVDIASVTAGYDEVISTLKTADWFSQTLFPKAVFKTTSFEKFEDNKYIAHGNLTIRDKTVPVDLKFTFDKYSETEAVAKGTALLSRNAFGIGQGDWTKTDVVKDEVQLDFTVQAKK